MYSSFVFHEIKFVAWPEKESTETKFTNESETVIKFTFPLSTITITTFFLGSSIVIVAIYFWINTPHNNNIFCPNYSLIFTKNPFTRDGNGLDLSRILLGPDPDPEF